MSDDFIIMNANDFKILPVSDLRDVLEKEERGVFDFDLQLPYSNAFLYNLRSGAVMLIPNHLRDKQNGIIFNDKVIYEKYAKSERFPISNEDFFLKNFFRKKYYQLVKPKKK